MIKLTIKEFSPGWVPLHKYSARLWRIQGWYYMTQTKKIVLALLIFPSVLISFCIPGNHQICRLVNQQHSLHCQWDQPVRYHRGDIFENVDYVQVFSLISSSSYKLLHIKSNIALPPPIPCIFDL